MQVAVAVDATILELYLVVVLEVAVLVVETT
jgi:hypothetical protein